MSSYKKLPSIAYEMGAILRSRRPGFYLTIRKGQRERLDEEKSRLGRQVFFDSWIVAIAAEEFTIEGFLAYLSGQKRPEKQRKCEQFQGESTGV